MPVQALNTAHIIVSATTTGGTAPGGSVAPTGCSLVSPADISTFVTSVSTPVTVTELDSTGFGGGGFTAIVAGLRQGTFDLSCNQDYAAAQLNALLGLNGTVAQPGGFFFIEVRASSAARSAGNPGFIARVLHSGWQTFNAQVGQIPTVTVSLRTTGGFAELIA
jgi:hypothetical protein